VYRPRSAVAGGGLDTLQPQRKAQDIMNSSAVVRPGAIRVASMSAAAGPIAAVALGAAWLASTVSWRQAALFVVGAGAGLVLYHAAFGFTSAWRVFITDRRGAGLRAQMLMLAATCVVFFPVLAAGSFFGQPVRGSIAAPGLAVVTGAFIFGLGMQLGGGCASGTLYSAGGGSTRMVVVLTAFVAGSLWGTAHAQWWNGLPAWAPTSIVQLWGPAVALAASLSVFAAIALATIRAERNRHGRLLSSAVASHVWRGPWPLVAGALGLALVNIAVLAISGRPWGITSAFALWGAKVAMLAGVPVETWPYWSAPAQAAALRGTVAADGTSVTNAGIIIGALLAAILAGRFAPVWRVPPRSVAAALVGGLLLGYGARVASGCNIGAYFSGIASGSLHGWLWFPAAFAGNVLGTYLRPWFGLAVERAPSC
jgi:uncharacterized membrane protein YedE/YeeE